VSAARKTFSTAGHVVGKQLLQIIADGRKLVDEKKESSSVNEIEYFALELKRVSGALSMLSNRATALLAKEIGEVFSVAVSKEGLDKSTLLILISNALSDLETAVCSEARFCPPLREGTWQQEALSAAASYRLLSVINILRTERGEQAVSANEIYTIDLEVVPANQNLDASTDKFVVVAKNKAHQFQAALLAWYKDCQNLDSINILVAITDSLRLAAVERPHIQFFEVIAALIDSQRGCSQVGQSVRLLLAHVERYIRQLAGADTAYVPTALTKDALHHIAANSYQHSERVIGILGRYGLRDRRSGRGREIDSSEDTVGRAVDAPPEPAPRVEHRAGSAKAWGDPELLVIKGDSTRQALVECRHELALMERSLELWLADKFNTDVLVSAYDTCYRVMRCFELIGLDRQAKICLQAQHYLVELQGQGSQTCDNQDVPGNDHYMVFAEAIAALAYFLDEATQMNAAVSLNIDELLQLAEARLAELGFDQTELAPIDYSPPGEVSDQVDDRAEPIAVNEFADEAIIADGNAEITSEIADQVSSDAVDRDIINSFIHEASSLLGELNTQMKVWRGSDEQDAPILAIQRLLHTLKGSSHLAGYRDMGHLCHGLESMLASIQAGALPASIALMESFQQSMASMSRMLMIQPQLGKSLQGALPPDQIQAEIPDQFALDVMAHAQDNNNHLQRLLQLNVEQLVGQAQLFNDVAKAMVVVAELDATIHRLSAELDDKVNAEGRHECRKPEGVSVESAPVSSTGQALGYNTAASGQGAPTLSRGQALGVQKVRLAEAVSDLRLATNQVLGHVGNIETRIDSISDATGLMRQTLVDTRMVGLDTNASAYQRLVEQTAMQLEKNVVLVIDDRAIKFDRTVLSCVSAALGHLLRNAVDHGIESAALRVNAGKPARASILIACTVNARGIAVTVTDDGAGIDTRAVWRCALAEQLIDQDEDFSEEKALELLFNPAISTKPLVTQVSGRGVGLNAVKTTIEQLHGTVSVASELSQGTCFTLCLPYSAGLIPATIVTVAGQRFALPGQIDSTAINKGQADKPLTVAEKTYECVTLQELFMIAPQAHTAPRGSVLSPLAPQGHVEGEHVEARSYSGQSRALLFDDGDAQLALLVDTVEGHESIVIDPVGPQLSQAAYLAGIGLLEEGVLVPVLNPDFFLCLVSQSYVSRDGENATQSLFGQHKILAVKRILVVDDSLTTRRYCEKLLHNHGYHVVVAKTAEEALAIANEVHIDLLLTDLQLPQMDGFQLIDSLRQQPQYDVLPVVLISASDRDEEQVQRHGIAAWLNKPYRDQELYDVIKHLTDK